LEFFYGRAFEIISTVVANVKVSFYLICIKHNRLMFYLVINRMKKAMQGLGESQGMVSTHVVGVSLKNSTAGLVWQTTCSQMHSKEVKEFS
jgi:hypothetical protein